MTNDSVSLYDVSINQTILGVNLPSHEKQSTSVCGVRC